MLNNTSTSDGQKQGIYFRGTDFHPAPHDMASVEGVQSNTTASGFDGSLLLNTTLAGTGYERMRISPAGYVGIGTTSPGALLDVNGNVRIGSQTSRTTASNRGQVGQGSTYVVTVNASTTVDWNNGNNQELNTFLCDGTKTITMSNLKDGAVYSLYLSGSAVHSGICNFSSSGFTFKTSGGPTAPTAGKDALLTFAVYNTTVIYTMMDNLQ